MRINFIYLLYFKQPRHLTMWGLFKIGYAHNVEGRVSDIKSSIMEKVGYMPEIKVFAKFPLFSAIFFEKRLHKKMSAFRSRRIPKGTSGYTEWMDWLNVVTAIAFYHFAGPVLAHYVPVTWLPSTLALLIMLSPWPLDFLLIGLALMAIEIMAVNTLINLITGFNAFETALNILRTIYNLITCLI